MSTINSPSASGVPVFARQTDRLDLAFAQSAQPATPGFGFLRPPGGPMAKSMSPRSEQGVALRRSRHAGAGEHAPVPAMPAGSWHT